MANDLPASVRYVKNGSGGRWWKIAKARNEIQCGWWLLPRDILVEGDLSRIEECIRNHELYRHPGAATADFNALKLTLDKPSQHVWITFEESCLWWCTVKDGITVNRDEGKRDSEGSFWLTCDRPWSNHSLGGRLLARANLPGKVSTVAGFRATICEPSSHAEILRAIEDREDPAATAAAQARGVYIGAVENLITKLHPRDFELLIDLILTRTGWIRTAELGRNVEGTDIEAENVATNERAFVQVKSRADQHVLNDYIGRFQARREQFDRLIFAVHSPDGTLTFQEDGSVQVWLGRRIAELSVKLGLGEWIANRL